MAAHANEIQMRIARALDTTTNDSADLYDRREVTLRLDHEANVRRIRERAAAASTLTSTSALALAPFDVDAALAQEESKYNILVARLAFEAARGRAIEAKRIADLEAKNADAPRWTSKWLNPLSQFSSAEEAVAFVRKQVIEEVVHEALVDAGNTAHAEAMLRRQKRLAEAKHRYQDDDFTDAMADAKAAEKRIAEIKAAIAAHERKLERICARIARRAQAAQEKEKEKAQQAQAPAQASDPPGDSLAPVPALDEGAREEAEAEAEAGGEGAGGGGKRKRTRAK